MDMTEKAHELAETLLARFEQGEVGAALARVFVETGVPHERYSITNRLFIALAGATDARTSKQWFKVGRKLHGAKGKGILLFRPTAKGYYTEEDEDGNKITRSYPKRYGCFVVYDIAYTEGDPVDYPDVPATSDLPLIEAAEALGVEVRYANLKGGAALGWYSRRTNDIVLGVENLRVFLHELAHAADHANGTLVEKANSATSEVVADLTAAVLAHMVGRPEDADEGSVFQYIKMQAERENKDMFVLCHNVLNRVADVVGLIMSHAGTEVRYESTT